MRALLLVLLFAWAGALGLEEGRANHALTEGTWSLQGPEHSMDKMHLSSAPAPRGHKHKRATAATGSARAPNVGTRDEAAFSSALRSLALDIDELRAMLLERLPDEEDIDDDLPETRPKSKRIVNNRQEIDRDWGGITKANMPGLQLLHIEVASRLVTKKLEQLIPNTHTKNGQTVSYVDVFDAIAERGGSVNIFGGATRDFIEMSERVQIKEMGDNPESGELEVLPSNDDDRDSTPSLTELLSTVNDIDINVCGYASIPAGWELLKTSLLTLMGYTEDELVEKTGNGWIERSKGDLTFKEYTHDNNRKYFRVGQKAGGEYLEGFMKGDYTAASLEAGAHSLPT